MANSNVETIKVFMGMEFGRFDGYEFMQVLKTYNNGMKLCYLGGEDTKVDATEDIWEQLIIAKPDDRFGWYAQDGLDVRTTYTPNHGLMFRDTVKEREF